MKKTININLGGKPFIIDEDAYKDLDKYLNAIEKHFSKSEGFEDILYDIEVRISELLEEEGEGGQIINLKKLEKVKNTMGRPQDFGASAEEEIYSNSGHEKTKRLFRDPDEKVIAGVSGGLAAYFGIKDPVIVRILFVFLAMTSIGLLLYIILWIVIPYAKTSSDFLAMRGEEINIENIAKTVEDGFDELKNTFDDLHDDIKSKMTK